jgi:cyclopropane fatty-acyl-phospholipid synthase-like methyltransferase
MKPYRYVGEELDVFAHAHNWKTYLRSAIGGHLTGDVLEVGAGIGGTTRVFCDGQQRSWTCLEPDPHLVARLERSIAERPLPIAPRIAIGTLIDLPAEPAYDAILYIDVLEHIEDDRTELKRASARLKRNGVVVVLSPAHQQLYTAFDANIGHFRRYNSSMFRALTPPATMLETLRYLDSAGMLLTTANRFFLRSGQPTLAQVRLWDRFFVATSRRIDPLLGYRVGKSLLGIWRQHQR